MMKLTKCALCSIVITDQNNTREHIIPNAIGGRRKIKNFICNTCNNKTGEEWDAELAKQLAQFCTMFSIKKDRGDVPPLRVMTSSGEEYLQFADGTFQPLRPKFSSKRVDDKTVNISIMARTIKEARQILKGIAKEHGLKDEKIKHIEDNFKFNDSYFNEPIESSLQIGGEKSGRSIVKTALALAVSMNIEPESCDLAINYLTKDGEPNFGYYYEEHDLVKNREIGSPFHCVYIKASADTKQILGYMEYFGCYRMVICLSNSYTGENRELIYAINPMTGEEVNLKVDLNFTRKEIEEIYNYKKLDQKYYELAFEPIIANAVSFSKTKEMQRLLEKGYLEAQSLYDNNKTEEQNLDIQARHISSLLMPYIWHNYKIREKP